MKLKILLILLFVFSPQVFASCYDNVDVTKRVNDNYSIFITAKSKTNRPMTLYNIRLIAKDKTVMKQIADKLNLKTYGKGSVWMYVSDVNMDFAKYITYDCKYVD